MAAPADHEPQQASPATASLPMAYFQMPTLASSARPTVPWVNNAAEQKFQWPMLHSLQAAQQPQFVVFELPKRQLKEPKQLSRDFGGQQQVMKLPTVLNNTHRQGPFLPIGNSQKAQNELEEAKKVPQQPQLPEQLRFTTVQLEVAGQPGPGSRGRGRLLFDNPMFRRLPNWHFFGDDRRLAPIPALIPILPVVERTLLYIAPSPASVRHLMSLNNMLQRRQQQQQQALPGTEDAEEEEVRTESFPESYCLDAEKEEEEEEDGTLMLLPNSSTVPECPSSTSGVESMSSAETATTTARSSRATSPAADEKDEEDDDEEREGCTTPENGQAEEQQEEPPFPSASSRSSSSAAESTTNSPSRRVVRRMSRGTRDAVRRLSRRFADDEEEEEESVPLEGQSAAASPLSFPSTLQTISMMSNAGFAPPPPMPFPPMIFRNRHASAGNASGDDTNGNRCTANANNKRPSADNDDYILYMDVLSEHIYNFYQNEEQTHNQLSRKLQLRDQLFYAISPIFPLCGLYIVGSSLNGFGTNRSDLDLCMMITNRDIDQRSDAVVVLSLVMRSLESNPMVAKQQLILAKVPILRIIFNGTFSDIMVDLNVNNSVAIRNTHLLCFYSAFDWRVRPLVMIVKEWAKRRGINNSSCSSFTSYSLVLMVIHFLQCGAEPHVLPNLQKMYANRFNSRADVRKLNVSQTLDPNPIVFGWKFRQETSLSELLLGFLHYFAFDFNFDVEAISIRMGQKMTRAQAAQNQSPYNTLSNAAHSVYDDRIFQDIKKAFVDSYHELDKQRDLNRFLGPPLEKEQLLMGIQRVPSTSSTCAAPTPTPSTTIIPTDNQPQQNGTTTPPEADGDDEEEEEDSAVVNDGLQAD